MVMGKHKGNSFENKIYKELREILPDIKLTIGSGNSERDADLISDKYIFELKHYKTLSDKQLNQFFNKVAGEGREHDKIPILLFKENYKEIKAMLMMYNGDVGVPAIISYDNLTTIIGYEGICEYGL